MTTLQVSLHATDRPVARPPKNGDFVIPLRRWDLSPAPGISYRGPWRLPGPALHRLAALSLSLGYTTNSFLAAPELLDAQPF